MTCLHCGAAVDYGKRRGDNSFCSDGCRGRYHDEVNQQALSRLMQPRRAPKVSSPAPAREVAQKIDTGAGVTVVLHPRGATEPVVSEPPEAEYIRTAEAVLVELKRHSYPPLSAKTLEPFYPGCPFPPEDGMAALARVLKPAPPDIRGFRAADGRLKTGTVAIPWPPSVRLDVEMDPVWPDGLGLTLQIQRIDETESLIGRAAPASLPVTNGPPIETLTPSRSDQTLPSRRVIPGKRDAVRLPAITGYCFGTGAPVPVPNVAPPRLRIHLPKPSLLPLRPRFAFAPKEQVETGKPDAAVKPSALAAGKPAKKSSEPSANAAVQEALQSSGKLKRTANEPKREEAKPVAESRAPELKLEQAPQTAPSFGGMSESAASDSGGGVPGWAKIAAVAVVVAGGGGWYLKDRLENHGKDQTARMVVGVPQAPDTARGSVDTWSSEFPSDPAGAAVGRRFKLYKAASGRRDYVMDFTGTIEENAIGWVFRVKDPKNYYCMKVENADGGSPRQLQLVRFAVIDGVEQAHKLIAIPASAPGGPIRIRADIRGSSFSTQVNGKPVDVWIDNRIGTGGIGFTNDRVERAVITAVKVSY